MHHRLSILIVSFITAVASQRALADSVDPAPDSQHWLGMVIVAVLLLGVIVASIKSAKRSHQD